MKYKFIMQTESKNCGATCLYNIIKYYGGNIDFSKLNNMLKTTENGTSIYQISKCAEKLGLICNAYKCEINDLCDITFPIIAHIKVEGKYEHYVIIYKMEDYDVFIFDPIRGYITYDSEKFEEEWSNIIITFEETKNLIYEKPNDFKKIFRYILNNKKNVLKILLFSLFIISISVLYTLYFSYLFDKPQIKSNIFILLIILIALKTMFTIEKNKTIFEYMNDFDEDITYATVEKILSLPIEYYHNRPIGDIVSRINDISCIKDFVSTISFSFITDLIFVLLILIMIFIINKIIFIIFLIIAIIYVLIYFVFRKDIIKNIISSKEKYSYSHSFLVECLLAIDTIKNLKIEKNMLTTFKNRYMDFIDNNHILKKILLKLDSTQNLISNLASIIIIFISIKLYQKNDLNLTYVITLNFFVTYCLSSMKNIISLDSILIQSKSSFKRLNDLLLNQKEEETNDYSLNRINTIEFKNLKYSYDDINDVFTNVSFDIKKGDYVFIKGESGIGKSTIFKLLLKQLPVENNMIRINNKDINDISKEDLINNICLVSQNEYIFTNTILDNIILYEQASDKQIKKVLKVTKVDEILKRRNISLDFILEENGHNLSKGERQRILIARSLIRNKKVLILDETTNELDVSMEREILKNIKTEYNITLILISHRSDNSDLFDKEVII